MVTTCIGAVESYRFPSMNRLEPTGLGSEFRGLFLHVVLGAEAIVFGSLGSHLGLPVPDLLVLLMTRDLSLAAGLFLVLHLFLIGLLIDSFVHGLVYVFTHDSDGKLKQWMVDRTNYPSDGWLEAQQWIWRSPAANREFGQLRFLMRFARATALLALIPVLYGVAGLCIHLGRALFEGRLPGGEAFASFGALLAGIFVSLVLFAFWLEKKAEYHRLVADAGRIGAPDDG